jgi:hypothetical protein
MGAPADPWRYRRKRFEDPSMVKALPHIGVVPATEDGGHLYETRVGMGGEGDRAGSRARSTGRASAHRRGSSYSRSLWRRLLRIPEAAASECGRLCRDDRAPRTRRPPPEGPLMLASL